MLINFTALSTVAILKMKYKKNIFESVLMRWMKLEPIIQSEVSQKEKDKYCILTHTCGILTDSTLEGICRSGMETQM